jgi:hypothetical protein
MLAEARLESLESKTQEAFISKAIGFGGSREIGG